MISKRILEEFVLKDNSTVPFNFYLFDENIFLKNIEKFKNVFSSKIYDVDFGYSVKTNPEIEVIKRAVSAGLKAEIVSPHELQIVKKLGVKPFDIIYNGVIPDYEGKFEIAHNGGYVNIESYNELKDLEIYAESMKHNIEVGLRVNVDIGNGRKSRFGIELSSEEMMNALKLLEKSKYISLNGIHSHVYGGREVKHWKTRTLALFEFAKKLNAKYVDLGSNMYGIMDPRMSEQFQEALPSLDDYASTISESLETVYKNSARPKIIFEPGTPIIANAISILAKIENIRTVRGSTIATLSCSEYDCGFTPSTKNIPIDIINIGEGQEYDNLIFYGYTCTEGDVLNRGMKCRAAIGDYVILRNIGAYSCSLKNHFIMPPPEFISITESV